MSADRRRRCSVLLVVLGVLGALALSLSACGGGGDPAPGASAATVGAPTSSTAAPAPGAPGAGPAAGRFVVDGARITGPDGRAFVPRGVNLLGPQSFWDVPTAGLAPAVADWGLNAVRLTTCLPGGCDDADGAVHAVNDDLDAIVEELTSAGIVVVIALHQVGPGSLPSDAEYAAMAAWWRATARRYAGNPHVWFNLVNEPGREAPVPRRWRTVHEGLIETVRAEADNVVVVDGSQYGQEAGADGEPVTEATSAILRYGPELLAAAGDIVFSVHVYDRWAPSGSTPQEQVERLDAFARAVTHAGMALLIGETGGEADEPDGRLAQATRAAYAVAGQRGLGLFAWHGQARDGFALVEHGRDPEATFADRDRYRLTWHGQLLWDLVHAADAR